MKHPSTFNNGIKICIAIVLALNLVNILNRPVNVASDQLYQLSSETLYQQALSSEFNRKDLIYAAIYMFAYVQQNPPEYANNYYGRRDLVDRKLQTYFAATNDNIRLLNSIKSDPNECKNSAGGQAELCTIQAQGTPELPPDAVLVCTKPNLQGACSILFRGNYRTHQSLGVANDSIASVLVGSQVKITLYAHALGDSPMITLTEHDFDLGNNLFSGKYPWSRNVSTAKVEWK